MKISAVKIKNFRGYGENRKSEDGFYTFDNLNEADFIILNGFNGFGKTSFYEAIEWCMTDKISRLVTIGENIGTSTMTNSSYIIFNGNIKNNRVAHVSIKFDDGTIIQRTTSSTSLQHRSYTSDFSPKSIENINYENIFKTNFLGQSSINSFLSRTKPNERASDLMKLIGLDALANIYENSDFSTKFRKLTNKETELTDNKKALEKEKEEVNRRFKTDGFENIDDYLLKLQEEIIKIKGIAEKLKYSKSWFQNIFSDQNIQINKENFYPFIQKLKTGEEQLQNGKNNYSSVRQKHLDLIIFFDLLNLYIANERLSILKTTDIKAIQDRQKKIDEQVQKNKALIESFEIIQKTLIDNEQIWTTYKVKYPIAKIRQNLSEVETEFLSVLEKYQTLKNKNFSWNSDLLSNVDNEIQKINFVDLKITVDNANTKLNELQNSIAQFEILLKETSSLNEKYTKVLTNVLAYIQEQDDITECPVCQSQDFTLGLSKNTFDIVQSDDKKVQLLSIINFQISAGNEKVKSYLDELNTLRQQLKQENSNIEIYINDKFTIHINNISTQYSLLLQELKTKTSNSKVEKEQENITLNTENTALTDKFSNYQSTYKQVFNQEFDLKQPLINIDESQIQTNNEKINSLKEILDKERYTESITKEVSLNHRDRLAEEIKGKDDLATVTEKINEYDLLIPKFDSLKIFFLTENEYASIENVKKLEDELKKSDETLVKINEYRNNINSIRNNCSKIRTEKLKSLQDNDLIQYIYHKINPNFRYKKLILSNQLEGRMKGIHFQSDENSDIYLDHIFSEAQLNIVALSIFLGTGLSEQFTGFEQLYMDDPIQSMDDLNVLALIDIFRNAIDSKKSKSFILATHDDNFAQLLQIKMRNKNIKTFNFVSYGNEGAIIETK